MNVGKGKKDLCSNFHIGLFNSTNYVQIIINWLSLTMQATTASYKPNIISDTITSTSNPSIITHS